MPLSTQPVKMGFVERLLFITILIVCPWLSSGHDWPSLCFFLPIRHGTSRLRMATILAVGTFSHFAEIFIP